MPGFVADAVIAEIPDLGRTVPVPEGMAWFPDDITACSLRWVLLHLIEETARHAGHADIIRESRDGATAIPLMAAEQGWPAKPWVQPGRHHHRKHDRPTSPVRVVWPSCLLCRSGSWLAATSITGAPAA